MAQHRRLDFGNNELEAELIARTHFIISTAGIDFIGHFSRESVMVDIGDGEGTVLSEQETRG